MTTQKKETLYHCRKCGRFNFLSRVSHKAPPGGSQSPKCPGDFIAQNSTPCFTCNFKANRACPDPFVIKDRPWIGCPAWVAQPTTALVPAVASVPATIPTLSDGHDQATAAELLKRFKGAQIGMRRVVSLGLFAWEIKETKLKHGQFGAWLAAHCPQLARVDEATGKAKPSSSISSYMALTKNVLESTGFTVNKYLEHISNSQQLGICRSGNYLLLSDKKLSSEACAIKDKICALVDGKSQRQLMLQFKQVENGQVKRGRLHGQGGASKLQRDAHQQKTEAARLEALDLHAAETAEWLMEVSDDKHLGLISDLTRDQLLQALDTAAGYLRRLARKEIPTT